MTYTFFSLEQAMIWTGVTWASARPAHSVTQTKCLSMRFGWLTVTNSRVLLTWSSTRPDILLARVTKTTILWCVRAALCPHLIEILTIIVREKCVIWSAREERAGITHVWEIRFSWLNYLLFNEIVDLRAFIEDLKFKNISYKIKNLTRSVNNNRNTIMIQSCHETWFLFRYFRYFRFYLLE